MPAQEPTLFTTSEAAALSGLTPRKINRLIDEGPLRGIGNRDRRLPRKDLLFLRLLRDVGVLFSRSGRDALYGAITSYHPSKSADISKSSKIHRVETAAQWLDVMVRDADNDLNKEISKLEKARQMVISDPEIRGGEPVIRGTRIPVHTIAEIVEKGAQRSALHEDYRLSAEQVELALLYARAYPKRGRPPKRPWRRKPVAIPD